MAGKNDQFSEMNRKNMETALRVAQLSFENSQRILAVQTELAKVMFQSGLDNLKAQTNADDPQALMQLRVRFAQESSQHMMAAAKQIAEISNAARGDLSRMVTEQLPAGSQGMPEAMQVFLKNLPGQAPNMMEAFQQSVATATAAFENLTKGASTATAGAGHTAKNTGNRAKRK